MRRTALIGLAVVGGAVGVWHLQFAMEAIFVFKEGEPLTSWLAMILGPLTTLLATIVAVFFRPIGGYWLLVSGLASSVVFVVGERGLTEYVLPFFLKFSLPMAVIGIAFIVLSRPSSRSTIPPQTTD